MYQIQVNSTKRCQLIDITGKIAEAVEGNAGQANAVLVYVPHTTAGVLVNECADPSVVDDMLQYLGELVPVSNRFRHSEGNSDAHIKSTITGCSLTIPVDNGAMVLGTWQGIFFAEFDGPRNRKVHITLL